MLKAFTASLFLSLFPELCSVLQETEGNVKGTPMIIIFFYLMKITFLFSKIKEQKSFFFFLKVLMLSSLGSAPPLGRPRGASRWAAGASGSMRAFPVPA